MKIGINLILNDQTLPMSLVAPMAESHGIEALFLGEHTHTPIETVNPHYPNGLPEFYKRFLDPFVQLSVAAALTSTIRLGTGVVLVAERNPLELAKAVSSIDVVSNGRFEFGVGYGWNHLELANNGVDPTKRRAVFREKMAALKALWAEEVAEFDGEFVSFTKSWSYPKPLQRPNPPVLIGAAPTKRCFEDVANVGDGWYPLGEPDLLTHLPALREWCGGRLPAVTVVEMEGQREGTPWYIDHEGALRALHDTARRYADGGIFRLSVGVPCDDASRLETALIVLAKLAEVVA